MKNVLEAIAIAVAFDYIKCILATTLKPNANSGSSEEKWNQDCHFSHATRHFEIVHFRISVSKIDAINLQLALRILGEKFTRKYHFDVRKM